MTSVFSAYALKHYFDEIHYIDILDCNGGDHGYPFATNFNPEINIREVSAKGSYWEDGHWVETEPMEIKREYDFPEVGMKDMYLLHHEEIESLALNIPGIKRIRFFMTFGQSYLTHLKCLENVGMTSIEPILYEGRITLQNAFQLYLCRVQHQLPLNIYPLIKSSPFYVKVITKKYHFLHIYVNFIKFDTV